MIRKANINDLNEILVVVKDAKELFRSKGSTQWQDTDGYPNYQHFLNDINKNYLYVNVKNGKIAGVVALGQETEETYNVIYQGKWINEDKYFVIHRIAVKKEFYGQGIAKELLDYLEKETLKAQVYNIKADTMEENVPMNNLLKKCGYQKCGIILLNRPNVLIKERVAYQKVLK